MTSPVSTETVPSPAEEAGMGVPYIDVTDAAARKVAALVEEEGDPHLKLRVYVMGGGCSGFQYGFAFEAQIEADDQVFVRGLAADTDRVEAMTQDTVTDTEQFVAGVVFLIDGMSLQYLHGAAIDYAEDVQGARFIIRNPNAKTTCGCGSSFAA